MDRIIEPELMDQNGQAEAFNNAQRDYSLNAIVYWYSQLGGIKHGKLLDLGCGPAQLTIKLAERYPELLITGIDGSNTMAEVAKSNIKKHGLENQITIINKLFSTLEPIKCDGLISTGTLHHMHNPLDFWNTIKKICLPGTWVFVTDILRPNNETDIDLAVNTLIPNAEEIFKTDFVNSLRAAFTEEEIRQQLIESHLNLTINIQQKENAGKMIFIYGQL